MTEVIPSKHPLKDAAKLLHKLFKENDVKPSHGLSHAFAVVNHCINALLSTTLKLSTKEEDEIKLAALLHDADDKKYFSTKNFDNARAILRQIGWHDREERIIHMISLVSTRTNGNYSIFAFDEKATMPGIADRIESVGKTGLARAYAYALEKVFIYIPNAS